MKQLDQASIVFTFDGTYEGLLSVVFESYRLKIVPRQIVAEEDWRHSLFEQPVFVETKPAWAKRVLQGIRKRSSAQTLTLLYRCFLSELPEVPLLIYNFIRQLIASPIDISDNFGDETVLKLHQIKKKINREEHRMHAFVRFQRTRDDIYYAVVEPDFNILPLLPPFFEKRYPAQRWLIYDFKRRFGIYYDLKKTIYTTFEDDHRLELQQLSPRILNESEPDYQVLWKQYFDSVNIPERVNMKLHLQHVPRRYWKYLSEKRQQF